MFTAGALDLDKIFEIHESGITAVVNLRFPSETQYQEGPDIRAGGMSYVSYPIRGGMPDRKTVASFSSIMREYEGQSVLVHCGSGNRAGIIWAAHLLDQGLSVDAALEQVSAVATRISSVKAIRAYAQKYHPDN